MVLVKFISFLTELDFAFPDHYDVKMPCHLILSKLADKCPSAVLAGQLIYLSPPPQQNSPKYSDLLQFIM